MQTINSSEELINGICDILDCHAYGEGQISFSPDDSGETVKIGDGTAMVLLNGTVTAGGFEDKRQTLAAFDTMTARALAHRRGDGIMQLCPVAAPVLVRSDRQGYNRMQQRYLVIYTGGGG